MSQNQVSTMRSRMEKWLESPLARRALRSSIDRYGMGEVFRAGQVDWGFCREAGRP